jgi:hypothetical protein
MLVFCVCAGRDFYGGILGLEEGMLVAFRAAQVEAIAVAVVEAAVWLCL